MDFILVLYLFNIEVCLGLPYERMKDIVDRIFRYRDLSQQAVSTSGACAAPQGNRDEDVR